ncbi:DNA-binding LacI/PurR family transcriptional regulator [Streptosporangium becharense]|uniref:DNA-binding LacI/PurR family transcriptional regulator n=1 Tax=Streptosporangium becharense TaxID=1816182 RepID=A0A7W9MK07_9ACTN|nr:LacI family DNA-binding transcriptional regulator [Streptosporangium becharense]MBB2914353.1 DNA-binding LacI/PurR family transcriptional regulator [Streptosporangium becharense]MBB5823615.1 DNA-binding LacI/PurR family transcriptional regulator [Streptosporangium becharense]
MTERRRRVTAADVARSLGLSRTTVGYVLNNTPGQTIPAATRERVLAEAARLGYRPHRTAQALASGRSMIILLVLPDWPMEHTLRQNLETASRILDDAGYALVTYTRHESGHARPLWELLNPDVVIAWTPITDAERASMLTGGITKIIPQLQQERTALASPTLTAGTHLQIEYLHEQGHRRLGFATSVNERFSVLSQGRAEAARQAADRLGVDLLDVRPVDHRDGSVARAVQEWSAKGVTAVAAFNDDIAAMTVAATLRAGLSVPGDLAVIGHDDTPMASMLYPSLSSVSIDSAGLGRHLANLALHAAEDRPLPETPPDLHATVVARESTRR